MKSFSFVKCQDVSARQVRLFGARLHEICFYKINADAERYVSFALTADSKVVYIEPYEY